MINKISIIGIGGVVVLAQEIRRLNKKVTDLTNQVDENSSSIIDLTTNISMLKDKLNALNIVIGDNLTEFQENLMALDMALDDIDVLKILADLQSAKVEAIKAIELAEGAYAFFNGPIELADYVSIKEGVIRYKTDYKIEEKCHIFTSDKDVANLPFNLTLSDVYVNNSRQNNGDYNAFIRSSSVTGFKMEPREANLSGTNLVFNSGKLIIPSSRVNRRYIIRFKNGQSFQGLNAFLKPRISDYCGDKLNISIGYNYRGYYTENLTYPLGNINGLFRVRQLTNEYLEIHVKPSELIPFSIKKVYGLSDGIYSYMTLSGIRDIALVLPLNNCVVKGVYTYIEGLEADNGTSEDIVL